jgi:glycosyltransferase involved in cell wall biosynthesis
MEGAIEGVSGIKRLGAIDPEQIPEYMSHASALILPSIWYENFPRTLVEAFGSGLPVIASRLGALAELVEDGVTGVLFAPGDAVDLASKIRWAQENPERLAEMGRQARARYESDYTPERNYLTLLEIYRSAIGRDKA